MPGGRPLTRKKEQAIAALLSAGSLARAAEQAGISERTLKNWLTTPDFIDAYRQARSQILEQSIAVMQTASIQAVATLVRNLSCGRAGAEIAAANSLLEKSLKAVEEFDILTRLARLEEAAAQQTGGTRAFNATSTNGTSRNGGR